MADRPQQACPLCGAKVVAGDGLEALGRHFQTCPKTETAKTAKPAKHASSSEE